MPLNEDEKLLVEAIESMLQQDSGLGLSAHAEELGGTGSIERGYEYLHNQIDEMFSLKAAELTHSDGASQAFKKTHSYKYIDDPTFKTAMEKEMVAQAIPAAEREKVHGFLKDILDEIREDFGNVAEKDFGFHPDLEEIMSVSQPEQNTDLEEEEVEDWPMKSNVEWVKGDASPGHMPSD
jgi:hypothetical protein